MPIKCTRVGSDHILQHGSRMCKCFPEGYRSARYADKLTQTKLREREIKDIMKHQREMQKKEKQEVRALATP
jgi:hypothetical protein